MKETLAALFALQQLDSSIEALKKSFAVLDPGKQESTTYKAAKSAHQIAESELQAARASLNDADLECKSKESKRASEEKKLYGGKITNPKELTALQMEVESLERQRDALQEKQVELHADLDRSHALEAQAKAAFAVAESALRVKKASYKEDSGKILAQATELIDKRGELMKPVPAPLLKNYDLLRNNKKGLAIVAIEDNNACGGCKMGLPSTIVRQTAKFEQLVFCENCFRILFVVQR